MREAATRLKALAHRLPSESAALQQARETADPTPMSVAADHADVLLIGIRDASATVRKGLEQHPHDEKVLRNVVDGIEGDAESLRERVELTRRQAGALQGASAGPLAALPKGPVAATPEEIQRQANENASPGLCDDSAMQGTAACPLDAASRDANREFVKSKLEEIADNWGRAVSFAFTEKKIEPLLEKDQGTAIAELLFGMALGWVGGMAASYAFKGLSRLGGVSSVSKELSRFDISDITVPTGPKNPGPDMFKTLGKKLGETGGKKLLKSAKKSGEGSTGQPHDSQFFRAISNVVSDWKAEVVGSVRQLPDGALVSLGAGLKTQIFTTDYFAQKLDQLVQRFNQLDKGLGKVIEIGGRGLEVVLVVHPSGAKRYALARKEIRWEHHAQQGHILGSGDPVDIETGRWTFVNWIDSSLLDMAHTIGKERHAENGIVLQTADLRWANLANADLVGWHVAPNKLDDVAIFDERKSP